MANVNIREVEGGQLTTPHSLAGLEIDTGTTSYWVLLADLYKFPDGTMINGKIAVSVASNDITVALKTKAGSDPSAADPVYIMINGTLRTCTAATSVTKNDGTQWFNLDTRFSGLEQDFFVYAIWNTGPTPDIVDIGFARYPTFRVYSNASGTTTNEKYLAFGSASTPNSTDDLCVIGRFAATLSASASYNWSVPTFTNANLIQYPIFSTRSLAYLPAFNNTTSTDATITGEYRIVDSLLRWTAVFVLGAGSAVTGNVSVTVPMTPLAVAGTNDPRGQVIFSDTGTATYMGRIVQVGSSFILYAQNAGGTYLTIAALSSTIPHTWASTDEISASGEFAIV